ncbi:hypothetical protein X798_03382 [Onchocerca flexuosa]|uniref:Uncharacterized protein n=1 Tax=Onchocerca flexuosa TaxID=387005 RepID=A0A238BYA8_9BILA|nr:hypothetical protein X798_03382 [Onchocerca flexuosa]
MYCRARLSASKYQIKTVVLRNFHDRCAVPRVVDDPEGKMHTITDAGYRYRYHRPAVDPLPRLPNCKVPVHKPDYKIRNCWTTAQARKCRRNGSEIQRGSRWDEKKIEIGY